MKTLRISKWEQWQSYRSDRGAPPWIKVHRCVMRNPDWVALTDAQRGQLVAIWLLAADKDGNIPASPSVVARLCYMSSEPDFQLFMDHGFIERDANMTSTWRQRDVNVTPQIRDRDRLETETEAETKNICPAPQGDAEPPVFQVPLNDGSFHPVTRDDLDRYADLYRAVDIDAEIRKLIGWNDANPTRRKTRRGVRAHITAWLARQQDRGGSVTLSHGRVDAGRDGRSGRTQRALENVLTKLGGDDGSEDAGR